MEGLREISKDKVFARTFSLPLDRVSTAPMETLLSNGRVNGAQAHITADELLTALVWSPNRLAGRVTFPPKNAHQDDTSSVYIVPERQLKFSGKNPEIALAMRTAAQVLCAVAPSRRERRPVSA
jgi:hypothetical protein